MNGIYSESLNEMYDKRFHPETPSSYRSGFQRDRDRIIYSGFFRKLERKTQVFMSSKHDYHRTQLTHNLEVAQVARSICKRFILNDDLAEAIALAYNLGCPPFGKIAEKTLNELAFEKSKGKFAFNNVLQSVRVVTNLERRYIQFEGLNLTKGTIEGIIKRFGEIDENAGYVSEELSRYCNTYRIHPSYRPPIEAQVVYMADSIVSVTHDLEDGLQSEVLSTDDIEHIPIIGDIFRTLAKKHPGCEKNRLINETLRCTMSEMIEEVCEQLKENLKQVKCPSDVAKMKSAVVAHSHKSYACIKAMNSVIHEKLHEHFKVSRAARKASSITKELCEYLFENPGCLPLEWKKGLDKKSTDGLLQCLTDYMSSLTDETVLDEWRECLNLNRRYF